MTRSAAFLRSLAIYNNPWAIARWARFYRGLLNPGDLAFDIGAHTGGRTSALRRAGAKVVAVEPQTPYTRFLRYLMPADVTVLDVAVGATQGEGTLAVSSRHPTVSTLSADFVDAGHTATGFENVRWDGAQQVSVLTLDGLIRRFGIPRYIKIDVEGGEAEVLAGLSHPVELISVEYLPALPALAHGLIAALETRGNTRFNLVRGESGRFLWSDWRDADAVSAWLSAQPLSAASGDLFAKRGVPMPVQASS